jgi:hypothetical protein
LTAIVGCYHRNLVDNYGVALGTQRRVRPLAVLTFRGLVPERANAVSTRSSTVARRSLARDLFTFARHRGGDLVWRQFAIFCRR